MQYDLFMIQTGHFTRHYIINEAVYIQINRDYHNYIFNSEPLFGEYEGENDCGNDVVIVIEFTTTELKINKRLKV